MAFEGTKVDCVYQVRKTDREISQLYFDYIKLLIRGEE